MGEDDAHPRAPAQAPPERGLVRDICATGVWRIFPLTLLYVVGELLHTLCIMLAWPQSTCRP
jgi:hypothetical protein